MDSIIQPSDDESKALSGALEAARAGHGVRPVYNPEVCKAGRCSLRQEHRGGDGKRPDRREGKHPWKVVWPKDASDDERQIKGWHADFLREFGVPSNWGEQVGDDRVVLDVDRDNGATVDTLKELPPGAIEFRESGNGWHVIYSNGTELPSPLPKGVEPKGAGQMVVSPGSVHKNGKRYRKIEVEPENNIAQPGASQTPQGVGTEGPKSRIFDGLPIEVAEDDPRVAPELWEKIRTDPGQGNRSGWEQGWANSLKWDGLAEGEVLWMLLEHSNAERPGHHEDYCRRTVATAFEESPEKTKKLVSAEKSRKWEPPEGFTLRDSPCRTVYAKGTVGRFRGSNLSRRASPVGRRQGN